MQFKKFIQVGMLIAMNLSQTVLGVTGKVNRCEGHDSLAPKEAVGRFEWLKKCPRGRALLVEHAKSMAPDAVLGFSDDEIIESLELQWILDPIEFNKTGKKIVRQQPDYVKLEMPDGTLWEEAPRIVSASCDIMPLNVVIAAICRSSCYHPSTALLFPEGEIAIADAQKEKLKQIMTLSEDSSFSSLKAQAQNIDFFVESIKDVKHTLVSLTMKSGKFLLVTQNHPLVTADGIMHQASELQIGESLVSLDGALDPIVQIDKKVPYFGKVHNVKTKGETPLSQIVFAEGYLSGSDWYQNEALKLMNSQIIRRNIADTLDF